MSGPPLLDVRALRRYFPVRNVFGVRSGWLRALDDVSFEVRRGEILGVVGESGCGKSTLGKTLIGIHRPTAGEIRFRGREIGRLPRGERRAVASELQYVYQDPTPRSTRGGRSGARCTSRSSSTPGSAQRSGTRR